jgi:hypothetical protein
MDYENDNKPVWPSWAVGVLSAVRDVETYNRGDLTQRLPSKMFRAYAHDRGRNIDYDDENKPAWPTRL